MSAIKESITELGQIVQNSENIVFFGGAGVSTEGGIPDFRSVDGLYREPSEISPETILSHSYYRSHPEEFFRFHREKMIRSDAKPNGAHKPRCTKCADIVPSCPGSKTFLTKDRKSGNL